MDEEGNGGDSSLERTRDKLNHLLYVNCPTGSPTCSPTASRSHPRSDTCGRQKSYKKGDLALKHAIGLGATPNVIPIDQPLTSGPPRLVEVGWHPVGGLAGKWFAEKTGLGKLITDKINEYPDPTQHWAMLVGDYAHQLWMDENFDIIYTNARIDRKE
jgi:hypothetical protein